MAANLAGRWVAYSVGQRADQWGVNWAAARVAPSGARKAGCSVGAKVGLMAETKGEMWADHWVASKVDW